MTKLEEVGVPADLIIRLFETLNDSDKLTRDQLKELTSILTKLVISNELKNCEVWHRELRDMLSARANEADDEMEKISEILKNDISTLLVKLTTTVNLMIKTVLITFSLLTLVTTIAVIVAKFMD